MAKQLLILFLLTGIYTGVNAQNSLLFTNPSKNKIIRARIGDQLSLQYTGYLGQREYFKQAISGVTDSSVILGIYFPEAGEEMSRKLASMGFTYKEILFRDITMFRRISVARTLLKTSLQIGTIISSVFLVNRFYQRSSLSPAANYVISIGIGIGSASLINICLPDKPKYRMKDGWKVETLK